MSAADIREKNLFPAGFLPLPHPNHPEGGLVFPKFHIDEIKKQEARDLKLTGPEKTGLVAFMGAL